MALINSLWHRGPLIFVALAAALGIAGNLAPGVIAEAAGYALFGIVLASPGIAIISIRRAAKRVAPRPALPAPFTRRAAIAIGLAVLAIIGAIVVIFAVVALGKIIGEPGTEGYPDTATRVLIISATGVPVMAALAFLLWQSLGPRKYYRRAMAKFFASELSTALDYLEAFKRRRPKDAAGWEATAMTLLSLGRAEEALANANQAVKLRRRWQGLFARGLILFRMGATEEALHDLEESVALCRSPIVQSVLGSVLVSLRRLDSAMEMLRASHGRFKWSYTALALAEAYRLRGMASEARSAYEEAASLAQAAGVAAETAVLAYAQAQLGRLEEAAEAARSVVVAEDAGTLALYTLALVSLRRGDLPTAEEHLRELADRSPHSAVEALMDPDFSALMANDRFKRLLGAAMLSRDDQVRRARELLAGGASPGVP